MQSVKNAILIVLISSMISCNTKKLQTESKKSEIEKIQNSESEFFLKKTSKSSHIKFGIDLDSLINKKFKFDSTDTSFFFAELKDGKIKIVYVNKNAEETIEKKEKEKKEESQKEKTESKSVKENENKKIPFEGIIGILLTLIGFLLFFRNRKNIQ